MIFIRRTDEPAILQSHGLPEREALCIAWQQGAKKLDFKASVYAHESVKAALKVMQHDKCCFCEAKLSHISYGDVEHYRPKGGYKQTPADALQQPGYYWLAYTWENLLLSCTLCNQQYKKNVFPVHKPEYRSVLSHDYDLSQEEPLLINPTLVNPQDYIGFREEVPYAINGNVHGTTTIAVLGLDREALNENRRSQLAALKGLLDVVALVASQPELAVNDEMQELVQKTRQLLSQMVLPSSEYSAMVCAYIGSGVA
jgi:uncharacterized protein (TIGR02646 family)